MYNHEEKVRVLSGAVAKLVQRLCLSPSQVNHFFNRGKVTDMDFAAVFVNTCLQLFSLVGEDDSKTAQWLKSENRHLFNKSPIELMSTVHGLHQVEAYLHPRDY